MGKSKAAGTTPKPKIKLIPEDGWELHSPYGALQDTERRPLERLEAVHALLMKRDGLTSMNAAVRVFGPFMADANSELGMKHGADKLRPFLMVCDKADSAYSLFPADKYADRSHQERLADLMPYVPHGSFARDTPEALLYALAQMAAEVWAPYSGDFDLNDRPCADFADGYFPAVVKAREILGPLAVRQDLAHKLWEWGGVAVMKTEESEQPVDKDSTLQERLDAYEKRGSNVTRKEFAKKLGLTEANLKKQLGTARRLRAQNKSNPWSGLKSVGGKKVANR